MRYGLMAEFTEADALLHAAENAYQKGYRKLDAYSPFPIHGLAEAIGFHRTGMPPLVLAGGVLGCLFGFGLCYYMAVIAYPHNVGGRPLNSWPAWIPITFECTVLFAALSAVIGMVAMNRLPEPYHPVFNVTRFERASQDRFFLCIQANDPLFEPAATRTFLESLGPEAIENVEA